MAYTSKYGGASKYNLSDGYITLANAIILNAMNDYKQALKYKDWCLVYSCERFIKSTWFETLTTPFNHLDPDYIIEKMRSKYLGAKDEK